MNEMTVLPDASGRPRHWWVNGRLIAGPESAEEALRLYAELGREKPALTPTADDVRAEAARRMRVLMGARDDRHLAVLISNNTREATRLLQKEISDGALAPEEQARKRQLRQIDDAIEAIRAASNRLEAMEPIPDDFADDRWWP